MKFRICLFLMILTAFPAGSLFAGEFSYQLGAAALVFNREDNLWARGNSILRSLSSKAEAKTWFLPVPVIELRYKTSSDGAQISFGTSFDEAGAGGLGISVPTQIGRFRSNLFYSFIATAWKDPYLVAVERETTSAQEYGGRLALEDILHSGIGVGYKITGYGVKDDLSGARFNDLKRDGFGHRLNLVWRRPVDPGWLVISPEFTYERREIEGSANSFNGYEPGLGITVRTKPVVISTKLSGIFQQYDSAMPVPEFNGATREEKGYAASLILTIPAPFGLSGWSSMLGAIRRETFSNIEFFDSSSTMGFAGMNYQF